MIFVTKKDPAKIGQAVQEQMRLDMHAPHFIHEFERQKN